MAMTVTSIVALLSALVACAFDVRTRRIPNALTLASAVAALVFHAITGGAEGWLTAAGGWAIGIAIFFVPFALGGMGGGDVKLLGALGAWLGPIDVMWLALYTSVVGGVLALIVAIARGYLQQAISNIWLLLAHWRVVGIRPLGDVSLAGSSGPRLAYAVPVFLGTLLTTWLR